VAKPHKINKKPKVTSGQLPFSTTTEQGFSTILLEIGRLHEKVERIEKLLEGKGEIHERREPHKDIEKEFVDIDLKILDFLESHGPMSSKELAQRCGFKDRSSFQKRYLRPMVFRKLIFPVKRGRIVVYRMEKGGGR
jgi:AraC-like DNA-binding protein